ncbi:SDR family oxidoreductase [Ruegeria atlantica]|uniref:SDR family oxidoreductase n=1 Tax=Ruegeria atlantica TaxID=81569 RepID=UPI00148089E2|nr:SDR family oxidoreductase [Ruegeria atlantica]
MTQTILITGASSGIGKETARLFAGRGWNVIATMRAPEKEEDLTGKDNILITRLDVTDAASIEAAVAAGIDKFNNIDVLLNNAGYGAYGPLEAFPMERVRRQFDTNVIGLLKTTKALLPHMRANRSGTIVNISSIGGQMTFPLGALYHGTKFAVEGISEALHYELESAGVKMKLIEPGMIATDFGGRSFDFVNDEEMTEYQPIVQALFGVWGSEEMRSRASPPSVVADVIWTSVTDGTNTLRYRAGADAVELLNNRKALDDETFFGGMKAQLGLQSS